MLSHEPDDGVVFVTVPMAADYRTSFSGSALPFPREDIAFGSRLRSTRQHLELGTSVVNLSSDHVPNWYYRNGIYGPPFAKVAYHVDGRPVVEMHEIHDVPHTPGRSLTARRRTLTTSYRAPVETQEQALRTRAMPGRMCHAP